LSWVPLFGLVRGRAEMVEAHVRIAEPIARVAPHPQDCDPIATALAASRLGSGPEPLIVGPPPASSLLRSDPDLT